MSSNFKLFVPGPVEIDEETRRVGAQRLPYMRTAAFSAFTLEVVEDLRRLLGTTGDVAILTASGTAAMEATVLSLFGPADRVLVIDGGTFGRRFVEICEIHGVPHEVLELSPGQDLDLQAFAARLSGGAFTGVLVNAHETSTGALYDVQGMGRVMEGAASILVVDAISSLCADPYRMDDWGVDATIFSSQKGLALPPGLAFVALGPRARARALTAPRRSLYLHLADYLKDGKRGQTPYTVAVGLLLQTAHRLRALHATGMDAVVAATAARARAFRAGLSGLPVQVLPARPSNALTALRLQNEKEKLSKEKLSAAELVERMAERHGLVLAPNGGSLRESVFRVSHLGDQTLGDVAEVLSALRAELSEAD
jgi:aspartate aminotransferase-like enzyme